MPSQTTFNYMKNDSLEGGEGEFYVLEVLLHLIFPGVVVRGGSWGLDGNMRFVTLFQT